MDDMYNDENQNENQNGTPDENQNENERENNGVNVWGSSEGGNGQQPGMEEQSQQSGRSTVQEQLQQQYRQPTVQEQLQYQYQQPQDELEEPMTMGEWMITLLIMLIPCANIIMAFVWAFSSTEKKSKSNFFKAYLIFMAIVIVLSILAVIVVGVFTASVVSSSYYYG